MAAMNPEKRDWLCPVILSPEERDWFCRNVLTELAVYLDAVISGSRRGAHEKLNKSPAAVGQGLARMEASLAKWLNGGSLINHSLRKSVQTTEAGDLLLEFAQKTLAESERIVEKLCGLQHSTELRLACIHSSWMAYGPKLQESFAERLKGGTILAQTIGGANYMEKIVAEVREHRADAGITSYPPKVLPPLVLQPLREQKMVLVFSSKYPKLPKQKDDISLRSVISDDPTLRIAIHRRSSDSPLGNQVVHYLKKCEADLGLSQLFEVQNIAEIKQSIEAFPGMISILPEDVIAEELAKGTLKSYTLAPKLKPFTWGLVYRSGTSRKPLLQFIECMRPLFAEPVHRKLRAS